MEFLIAGSAVAEPQKLPATASAEIGSKLAVCLDMLVRLLRTRVSPARKGSFSTAS